jgi:hypothetical protein
MVRRVHIFTRLARNKPIFNATVRSQCFIMLDGDEHTRNRDFSMIGKPASLIFHTNLQ